MGKVRGGDLSVLRDGGIPLSDPSLRSQRGREARQPFGIPGHCGAPLAGERHRPPSLASILIRVRHVAGVSPESHSFPARVAAFRVGPLGDASSARGGAGGCGARRTERPTAGVGRGRAAAHPATGGSGQAYLASVTLGPGVESAVAPVYGGCSTESTGLSPVGTFLPPTRLAALTLPTCWEKGRRAYKGKLLSQVETIHSYSFVTLQRSEAAGVLLGSQPR